MEAQPFTTWHEMLRKLSDGAETRGVGNISSQQDDAQEPIAAPQKEGLLGTKGDDREDEEFQGNMCGSVAEVLSPEAVTAQRRPLFKMPRASSPTLNLQQFSNF